ncbi:MAG: response regulator, partial [Planctomycetota bacterium]
MPEKMKSGATILVVDDDRLILQSCKDVLRAEDYRPILASSGEEGIEKIASESFDLIITDLRMTGKDGLDVLRFAKEREPEVPVIILTGYPTLTSAIESVRLGAFDYVCKPITPDEMLLVVN